MTPEEITAAVNVFTSLMCLTVAASAGLSGLYIWYVYRQRHEEALFLTRLVHRDLRVAIASILTGLLIAVALLGQGILLRPWGTLIIGFCLSALMYGVVSDAILWRRERRRYKP